MLAKKDGIVRIAVNIYMYVFGKCTKSCLLAILAPCGPIYYARKCLALQSMSQLCNSITSNPLPCAEGHQYLFWEGCGYAC